jgi:hypothetical protein
MARMRSIKPEFFADQDLAEELPDRDARLLYIGLWGLADEHGRLRGDARSIKGQVFAYDDDLTPAVIDKLIDMLAESGRAVRYRVEKATYLFLPKLAQHQRLEPNKTPSRLPEPPVELVEPSTIGSSEKIPDESGIDPEEFAPKQAACSKEHVASSRQQIPDDPAPLRSVPAGAEQATQIVIEAAGVEPYVAAEAVLAIDSERKPRNLPGLVRKLADAGELDVWLAKARKHVETESVGATIAAARASPPCEHGQPGGHQLHPVTQKHLCPLCRNGVPA